MSLSTYQPQQEGFVTEDRNDNLILKVKYENTTRLMTYENSDFEAFLKTIFHKFNFVRHFDHTKFDPDANVNHLISLFWIDEDGDKVCITGNEDLMLSFRLSQKEEKLPLTLFVSLNDRYFLPSSADTVNHNEVITGKKAENEIKKCIINDGNNDDVFLTNNDDT